MLGEAKGSVRSPAPNQRAKSKQKELPSLLRALRHRNFQLFFGGQLISLTGTWMQSVAQSWLVYRLTGSAVLLGLVGFSSQIPVFLLAPLGGVVADRVNRHSILLVTQTVAMILAFVLSALTLFHRVQVPHLFVLAALKESKRGEYKRENHRHRLSNKQNAVPVHPIGDDASQR